MSKIAATPSSIGRLFPLVVALAALFIWASVGHAQTEQGTYEPPGQQVGAVSTSAGASAGGGVPEAAGAGGAEVSGEAAAGTGGSGGATADSLGISLLPTTGGPLLPLIGLGAIALGATGLLARHRFSRR